MHGVPLMSGYHLFHYGVRAPHVIFSNLCDPDEEMYSSRKGLEQTLLQYHVNAGMICGVADP